MLTKRSPRPYLGPMPATATQELIEKWFVAKTNANRFKEEELSLRNEIVLTLFPQDKEEGVLGMIELPEGFQLKASKSQNYNLKNDEQQVEAICALLDKTTAGLVVRWKPELAIGVYKKLPKETQELFNGCLTIKSSQPTLEIVKPTEKK